jgi:hypothetical protein
MDDNVLKFYLMLDGGQVDSTVELTQDKLKELAGEVQQTAGAMKEGTAATNESTQATAAQGREVSKLTEFYRQERSIHRERSFMFREGRDAIMMMTFSLSALMNSGDNANETQRKFTRSLMEGFIAFQATDFAIKGLSMAMGATLSGGLTLAISAVVGAAILLKGILGVDTEAIKKQKEEVDKLRDSYNKLSVAQIEEQETELKLKLSQEPFKMVKGTSGKFIAQVPEYKTDEGKKLKTQLDLLIEVKNNMGDLVKLENQRNELNAKISNLQHIDDGVISPHNLELLKQYQNELTRIKDKIDIINGNSSKKDLKDAEKSANQFSSEKSQLQTDLAKENQEKQFNDDLQTKDYIQLLDMKSAAEEKYSALLGTLTGINKQTDLNAFETKKELAEKEIALITKKIDEDQKLYDDAGKKALENRKKRYDETQKFNEGMKKKYYEKVKYADPEYMTDQTSEVDKNANDFRAAGIKEIDITAYKTAAMKEIEQDYYDWKSEQYKKDHQLFEGGLNVMWAGYDTFFHSLTDTTMTGSQRLSAIWTSVKNSFIGMITDMLKKYLESLIMQAVIGDVAKSAEVGTAITTGTTIAAAYAPAAAFASIMSFGAADLAGDAGLSSSVALAYILSIPKVVGGFETGGRLPAGKFGFFEGYGNEIVAPEEDFVTVAHQLVGNAVIDARNYFNAGAGGNNNNLSDKLEARFASLEKTYKETPHRAYFDEKEARKVGVFNDSKNRSSRLS